MSRELSEQEITARFAAQMLGGEISTKEPPPGSALHDLRRLLRAVEEGEMTKDEMRHELCRLHPHLRPGA